MFKLFTFLFYKFPLILGWIYLLAAFLYDVVFIRQVMHKANASTARWIISILNAGYIIFFLVTRIFFLSFWESVFGVLGLLAIIVLFLLSRYEDKRSGRRWWNW